MRSVTEWVGRTLTPIDRQIEPPTMEPIDLEFAKKSLRFTSTSEDTLVDMDISMARGEFEAMTGLQVLAATWERALDGFPSPRLELPRMPLLSVTSVTYVDGDGETQTLTEDEDYIVCRPGNPLFPERGWIELVEGASWPTVGCAARSVIVQYIAGFGSAPADVPEIVRGYLLMATGDYFKYRTRTIETATNAFTEMPAMQMIRRQFGCVSMAGFPVRT